MNSANQAGNSNLMQIPYQFLPLPQQLDLMLVNKQWYHCFSALTICPISTFSRKGLRLIMNSPCV